MAMAHHFLPPMMVCLSIARRRGAAMERVSRRLENRKVTRDFPPELALVKADQALLEQALVNILENAIAYSPDNSTIELAAYEDRNNVVLSIGDEGGGIPTAELERVFEKFRRMEESSDRGKGAGLGLAISKGFVEAMGGRIAAASPIRLARMVAVIETRRAMRPVSQRAGRRPGAGLLESRPSAKSVTIR